MILTTEFDTDAIAFVVITALLVVFVLLEVLALAALEEVLEMITLKQLHYRRFSRKMIVFYDIWALEISLK